MGQMPMGQPQMAHPGQGYAFPQGAGAPPMAGPQGGYGGWYGQPFPMPPAGVNPGAQAPPSPQAPRSN
jgi:hypothetical protein